MITAVAIVPAEAWVDAPSLSDSPALKHLLKSPLNMTSKWFNGIIAPLGPLALRGVLYYQGEYNGGRGAEFQVLFPALIQSWRTSLEQPNLPFLFVQLPGFIEHRAEQDRQLDMDAATLAALHQPTLSGVWTDMREAQLSVWRSVPHTGMAVTIDVGEPYDIHPKQKEPVAERLLLSARQVAYGENVEGSSPVPARVEVDGVEREMTFITNNTQWSARTIAELYRARWTIEVFFKEIKQTLQLRDFVGTNEKAVKWQVWTGLLMHLLLRVLRHVSRWGHSFSRCVGIVRTALWVKTDLGELLRCYGTAGGPHRPVLSAKEPFLPGFEAFSSSPMGQHG